MKSYITSDPKILSGKKIIKGTRIPVSRIVYLLKDGYTVDNIADQYPHVNRHILNGVIDEVIESLDNQNAPQVL